MEIAAKAPALLIFSLFFFCCFVCLSGSSQGQKRRGVEVFLLLVCEWVGGGFLAENQGLKSTQVRALIFPCNLLPRPTGSSQSLRNFPLEIPNQKSMFSEKLSVNFLSSLLALL